MERILKMVEELTGEDGKIEAAALSERLKEERTVQERAFLQKEKQQLAAARALVLAGAEDAEYLLYRMGEKAEFDENGRLLNGEAFAAEAKACYPGFFREKEREDADLLRREKRELAAARALVLAGAEDAEYLLYRMGEKAEFDENGRLLNGEAFAAEAKACYPGFFREKAIRGMCPAEGESGSGLGAAEFSRMGFRERAELFEKDPELYRSLQSGK